MKKDTKKDDSVKDYVGLTIRFPKQEWKALKLKAFQEEVSMSQLIREAVKQLLEK